MRRGKAYSSRSATARSSATASVPSQKVFIDRWYYFQGSAAENSYLGLLLQLGVVGLALVLAMGCALIFGGVRALRYLDGDDRILAVAGLGVVLSAAAIMLIQSYLYSVGNVATATVWISMFALAPIALEPRAARAGFAPRRPRGSRDPPRGSHRHRSCRGPRPARRGRPVGGTPAAARRTAGIEPCSPRSAVTSALRVCRATGFGDPACLAYHTRTMALALPLCFDSEGRLIQTVDRRPEEPRYSSLEYEPSLSTIRFPPSRIDKLLQLAAAARG